MEARYARQPPLLVISGASFRPISSHRNPLIHSPLASLTLPTTSGGGTDATNAPSALAPSCQTSISIDPPSSARIMPGLAGGVSGSTNKRYCGGVHVCWTKLPEIKKLLVERLTRKWAPTTPSRTSARDKWGTYPPLNELASVPRKTLELPVVSQKLGRPYQNRPARIRA
jgi:hypothetical protein